MENWDGIVLAAGRGKRMRSKIPKPLHPLSGRPLISHAIDAIEAVLASVPVIVKDDSPLLPTALGEGYRFAVQADPTGTGGAVSAAFSAVSKHVRNVLVINGDNPFISSDSLRRMVSLHEDTDSAVTLLTARDAPQEDLGRIVRDEHGQVRSIVEAKHAGADRTTMSEVNCGAYCLDASWAEVALAGIPKHDGGEYYLTDLVDAAIVAGRSVQTVETDDPWESWGINTRVHLAKSEEQMRRRVLDRLMIEGVTIVDPDTTYIDGTVVVGEDTVIHPASHIRGQTVIGEDCRIGPGAQIDNTRIGDRCSIGSSVLESATLEDDVDMGPFCHLRAGAYLSQGVHMGNFGEVKNSRLGRNVQMGHFGYIGDADIGDNTNIAAGVITANFDGVNKNRTVIGEDVFLGVDTMLVAPVRVGARSRTGAGTVVNKEVPPDTLAIGVPARLRKLDPSQTEVRESATDGHSPS